MKRIYIAGPMTGYPGLNKLAFCRMEQELSKYDLIVLNPAVLPHGLDYDEYMHMCKAMIDVAAYVVFLHGWEHSRGAKEEYLYALNRGKEIIYEDDVYAYTGAAQQRETRQEEYSLPRVRRYRAAAYA